MKTDNLFYRLFVTFPNLFFQLIDRSVPDLDKILLQRIYLDQLREREDLSPELGVVRLVVETPSRTESWAHQLVKQVQGLEVGPRLQAQLLEVIETVLVYKYPDKSRKELVAMFSLGEMKETRYYQDAQETKAKEIALRLLQEGVDLDLIARATELTVEEIEALRPESAG